MLYKRIVFSFLIVVTSHISHAEWTPPDSPDLHEILNQAKEDRRSGRYKEALEKHVWFHENSLDIDQSFYGVRLSFALSDWVDLATVYPLAKEKLISTSDKYESTVKEDGDCSSDAFHSFASINSKLNRDEEVVKLFRWAHLNNSENAKCYFRLAQPSLIRLKEYMLSGEYIDPDRDLETYKYMYTRNSKLSKEPGFGEEMQEFAEKSFTNNVCILVATLVLNERNEEAKEIASEAKDILGTENFVKGLDKALTGQMPRPWP